MSSLLPSLNLITGRELTSSQLKSNSDLSVLKRRKKNNTAVDIANRMLLLITLLGVHIRDAATAFASPEILMLILSYCDFPTVMLVSRTNRHGRRVAQTVIRDRFHLVLDPYITSGRFGSFVELLETTGSGVTGSVARRLLALQSTFALNSVNKLVRTANLNVITPRQNFDACKSWFKDDGYVIWNSRPVTPPFNRIVISVWIGEKPVSLDSNKNRKVMLLKARSDIASIILGAPFSLQANLITGSFIYSLWLNLICKREALKTDLPFVRNVRHPTNNWPIFDDNSYWKEACGKYCPARDRLSTNDDVTGSFAWNGNASPAMDGMNRMDDLWKGKVYVYRFSKNCCNPRCKHYTPKREAQVL